MSKQCFCCTYIEAAGLIDEKYRPDATELVARKNHPKSAEVFKVTLKGYFKYLFYCIIKLVATLVLVSQLSYVYLLIHILIIVLLNVLIRRITHM